MPLFPVNSCVLCEIAYDIRHCNKGIFESMLKYHKTSNRDILLDLLKEDVTITLNGPTSQFLTLRKLSKIKYSYGGN